MSDQGAIKSFFKNPAIVNTNDDYPNSKVSVDDHEFLSSKEIVNLGLQPGLFSSLEPDGEFIAGGAFFADIANIYTAPLSNPVPITTDDFAVLDTVQNVMSLKNNSTFFDDIHGDLSESLIKEFKSVENKEGFLKELKSNTAGEVYDETAPVQGPYFREQTLQGWFVDNVNFDDADEFRSIMGKGNFEINPDTAEDSFVKAVEENSYSLINGLHSLATDPIGNIMTASKGIYNLGAGGMHTAIGDDYFINKIAPEFAEESKVKGQKHRADLIQGVKEYIGGYTQTGETDVLGWKVATSLAAGYGVNKLINPSPSRGLINDFFEPVPLLPNKSIFKPISVRSSPPSKGLMSDILDERKEILEENSRALQDRGNPDRRPESREGSNERRSSEEIYPDFDVDKSGGLIELESTGEFNTPYFANNNRGSYPDISDTKLPSITSLNFTGPIVTEMMHLGSNIPTGSLRVSINSQQKLRNPEDIVKEPYASLISEEYYPSPTEIPGQRLQGMSRFTSSWQELIGDFNKTTGDFSIVNREFSSGEGLEIPLDMTVRSIDAVGGASKVNSISEVVSGSSYDKFMGDISRGLSPLHVLEEMEGFQISQKLGFTNPTIELIKREVGYENIINGQKDVTVLPLDIEGAKQLSNTFGEYDRLKLTSHQDVDE